MKKIFCNFMLKIGLASDSVIQGWSSGEVKKPETINYKTEKPIPDGLFCEKIFGPIKNNECACGKYKRIRNKDKVCERCKVMVTDNIVRRRLMGHIKLDDPVVHIWYHRSTPSKLATFLNLPSKILEEIIYYRCYAVVNNDHCAELKLGSTIGLTVEPSAFGENSDNYILVETILKHLLSNLDHDSKAYSEVQEYRSTLESQDGTFFIEEFIHFVNDNSVIELAMGGLAIEKLLKAVNIDEEISKLKQKLAKQKTVSMNSAKLLKRLEILNNFHSTGQKPEWMVIRTIPVLPPELRPIVSLEGGRFAASGMNRLYTELLIRRNRLQKNQEKGAPIFMMNELRNAIQEAVDNLFDSSLVVQKPKRINSSQVIKSIATNLKGKTGRFRQNLLGKRVDYSAGSVITGGPELKLNQCGLPRDIAIVLFKSAIIGKLINQGIVINKKMGEKIIAERAPIVWDFLEEIIVNYPVILNRAPTLHRLGIQAFYPKLVRGQAITLHPLVTTAFNADFDGDRMAVHLPLTEAAKEEARNILLSTHNILNPRNGSLIMIPTQDIVLGIYYLTFEVKNAKGEGGLFADLDSVLLAYWNNKITLHTLVFCPVAVLHKDDLASQENKLVITTPGKLIFNKVFGSQFPYIGDLDWKKQITFLNMNADLIKVMKKYVVHSPINKSVLGEIINEFLEKFDFQATGELLDDLKDLGFKYSTRSGTTISLFDLLNHKIDKKDLFAQTEKEVKRIHYFLQISDLAMVEKKSERIKKWTCVKELVEKKVKNSFSDSYLNQPASLIINSGIKGSISNFTQLVGMRGLMINTQEQVIDIPIKSSLVEGLSLLEYYISTYGARKGMVDTALKTADSGYLTRRLVDATHDVYTVIDDCHTENYFAVSAILGKMNSLIVPLFNRIYGRFSAGNIFTAQGELLIARNQFISKQVAQKIVAANIKTVKIRSVLTCEVPRGVCCLCYGLDLAKNQIISKGQAVGVLASQSIGEPATQLMMRRFRGEVSFDITHGLPRMIELFDVVTPKKQEALIATFDGVVTKLEKMDNWSYQIEITSQHKKPKIAVFQTDSDVSLLIKIGQNVHKGMMITEGPVNLRKLLDITKDPKQVAQYIIEQVQNVYCLQGIDIADKYIEIVVAKMFSRSRIVAAGDSQNIVGQELENHILLDINQKLVANQQKPIKFTPIICGIKSVATKTNSFLSAASFQETTKVLIQATMENRVDPLYGLKENVIVGNLIPVGTGYEGFDEKDKIKEPKIIKVALGNDHAGFALKILIKKWLMSFGYQVVDVGAHDEQRTDFVCYAQKVALLIQKKAVQYGILSCFSGVGMNIASNRFPGVRSVHCSSDQQELISLARQHNDVNLISLGAGFLTFAQVKTVLLVFFHTPFQDLARYQKRNLLLDKITEN